MVFPVSVYMNIHKLISKEKNMFALTKINITLMLYKQCYTVNNRSTL